MSSDNPVYSKDGYAVRPYGHTPPNENETLQDPFGSFNDEATEKQIAEWKREDGFADEDFISGPARYISHSIYMKERDSK